MKTISNIFLGVCCLAALSACNQNKEALSTTEQPHEMSFTVSTGPETRSTLSKDGENLKRVWKAGDKMSVIFQKDGTNYNEIFTLTGGDGTTKGTFSNPSSNLPTTGSLYVQLLYPAGEFFGGTFWVRTSIDTQGNGSLSSAGDYDILTGYNLYITDGVFPATELSGKTSYLHIPTDLELIGNATGEKTATTLTLSGTNIAKYCSRAYTGQTSSGVGDVTLSGVVLNDGKVKEDVYIAYLRGSSGVPKDVKLTFTIGGSDYDYVVELNDPSSDPDGKVSHLTAGAIKTKPSM